MEIGNIMTTEDIIKDSEPCTPIEKTCICLYDYSDGVFNFFNGREYQVDVYPLFKKVYLNGGWKDYVFLTHDVFEKNFKIIN